MPREDPGSDAHYGTRIRGRRGPAHPGRRCGRLKFAADLAAVGGMDLQRIDCGRCERIPKIRPSLSGLDLYCPRRGPLWAKTQWRPSLSAAV